MKSYFTHDGLQKHGPFSIEELQKNQIGKDTPVWTEGLEDWTSAGKIDELKGFFQNTPPPFIKESPPQKNDNIAPRTYSSKNTSNAENVGFAIGKLLRNTTAVIVIIIVAIIIWHNVRDNNRSSLSAASLIAFDAEHSNPENYLVASGTYHPNFWGNKVVINGNITNNAAHTNYKDIIVKVTFNSVTHTEVDSKNYIIYDFVPYGSSKSFELRIDKPAAAKTCGLSAVGATYY